MIDLKVEIPRSQQARLLRALDPTAMQRAEVQALNRTAANVQTEALKIVAKEMGVPPSQIRKRGRGQRTSRRSTKFGVIRRGRKASRRQLQTSVVGAGRPANVTKWKGAVAVQAGASVSLSGRKRKGKGRVLGVTHKAYGRDQFAPNTFMLKNKDVVKRRDNDDLTGVYGPGVAQTMEDRQINRKLEALTIKRFDVHFKSAVEFEFSPAGTSRRGARRR